MKMAYSYIRFSSPPQMWGDSLRRQLAASEAWAERTGYQLDNSLKDMGVSAFKGLHRTSGALAAFLDLVKRGAIPKGSALVVESLDRLSREEVEDALALFLSIIHAGIDIVTLGDREEVYSKGHLRPEQLMISIAIMCRAHEESRTKSMRLRAAFANRLQRMQEGERFHTRCPTWLRWQPETRDWDLIPDKVALVKRIYSMFMAGHTLNGIATTLNREKVPTARAHEQSHAGRTRKRRNRWNHDTVKHFLSNPGVVGVYQPTRLSEDGRRVDTEPVADYFPRIIDRKLFDRVQVRLSERGHCGGQRADTVRNLLASIVRCGYCGGDMSRCGPRKGGALMCNNANRGVTGCGYAGLNYLALERAVLLALAHRISVADLGTELDEKKSELAAKRADLEAAMGALQQGEKRVVRLVDSISEEDSVQVRARLKARVAAEEAQQLSTRERAKALQREVEALEASNANGREHLKEIRQIITTLADAAEGDEQTALRRRLQNELKQIVDNITVFTREQYVSLKFRSGGFVTFLSLADRFRLKGDAVKPALRFGFLAFDLLGDSIVMQRTDHTHNLAPMADHELARQIVAKLDQLGLRTTDDEEFKKRNDTGRKKKPR
jgi:DNA invertase Pin-like site-specific DNA recombinase